MKGCVNMRKRVLPMLMAFMLCLSACGKSNDNTTVVTDDLGMDIVGEMTLPTLGEPTDTTVESSYVSTEDEVTSSETTTATSLETTVATTSETTVTTLETTVTSLETTVTTPTSETTPTTPITTIGTTSEIVLPFIDVTAGTTTGGTTEGTVTEETTEAPSKVLELKDYAETMNVITNKGKAIWYDQFDEKLSKAYNKLLSAVLKHKPMVEFDEVLTLEEYNRVFGILYGQNPQVFWLSGKTRLADDGKSATLFYAYDEKTSESMQILLDKRVKELLSMMSPDMTDLEKVLLCHNYIVKFNSYSKETLHATNAYGCLIDGKSQCSGYAKGFLYMCDQLGIPCIYVNGVSGETGNTHAWNKVYLNGDWYNVDCMWDDPEMSPEDEKNVSYRYMGVPDALIDGVTHLHANKFQNDSSKEYFKLPECTAYSENADIRYGVYATTYEEIYEKLKQGCIDAVKENRYCAHVKVESTEVYKDALERLIANKEVYNIRKELNAIYGEGVVVGFGAAPENKLNYIEVTLKYGEGYEP